MNKYFDYVDPVAIELYESDLLSDDKPTIPTYSKDYLDSQGCVFDSNVWNEQISTKEVMQKIIFDERMSAIWLALKKRASDWHSPSMFYVSLCMKISEIYPGPDDWSLLTPSQKNSKLEKISRLALELCKEIANTPLDNSVMDYANHKYYFDSFKDRCRSEFLKEKMDFSLTKFCKLIGDSYYVPSQDDFKGAISGTWSDVGVYAPAVSSLLQNVSCKAKEINADSVLKRKSQIKRAYFIRKLTAFFQEAFNTPLYNINAVICSVFLDEEITIEEVRSTMR